MMSSDEPDTARLCFTVSIRFKNDQRNTQLDAAGKFFVRSC